MDDGLDTIKVATLVSPPHEDQPLGDVCAGCAELTQRIEELERRLARVETSSTSTFMSAWTCYWSCVGFHALLVFVSFQSDSWESFGYSFLVGAVGTLVVCHALSTRTLSTKTLRSLTAGTVVLAVMCFSLWHSGESDLEDLGVLLAFYAPVMFFSSWLVAKTCVWTLRWRIVPPGGPSDFRKPNIRDLMWITLVLACTFCAFRWVLIKTETDLLSDVGMQGILYIAMPVVVTTLVSIFAARVILTHRPTLNPLTLVSVCLSQLVLFFVLYAYQSGVASADWGDIKDIGTYSSLFASFATISPVVTLLMMRSAGYQFALAGDISSKSSPDPSGLIQ